VQQEAFNLSVTAFLGFDSFPTTKVLKPIEVGIIQCDCACPPAPGALDAPDAVTPEKQSQENPFDYGQLQLKEPTSQEKLPTPPVDKQSLSPAGVRFRLSDG
jgi:hypothetical protein